MEGWEQRGKAGCAVNEMLGLLNEEIMSLCSSDTVAESDLKTNLRARWKGFQRRAVDLLNWRRSDELEELTAEA